MSQSMDVAGVVQSHHISKRDLKAIKLPNLNGYKNETGSSLFGNRRFKSTIRNQLNRSQSQIPETPKVEEAKLPTSFSTIAEALPMAITRKQMLMEKSEEENNQETNIKKLLTGNLPEKFG